MMETTKRNRRNVEKQDAVVSALWDFARSQQSHEHNCTSADGTTVFLPGIGSALKQIMDAFGYETVAVE